MPAYQQTFFLFHLVIPVHYFMFRNYGTVILLHLWTATTKARYNFFKGYFHFRVSIHWSNIAQFFEDPNKIRTVCAAGSLFGWHPLINWSKEPDEKSLFDQSQQRMSCSVKYSDGGQLGMNQQVKESKHISVWPPKVTLVWLQVSSISSVVYWLLPPKAKVYSYIQTWVYKRKSLHSDQLHKY